MFRSLVFCGWLVWLVALAVFAIIRLKARQREEQQREERREQRECERRQRSAGAVRRQARQPALRPNCRDQLIAAGVIKPAAEPDVAPDPATSM